MAANAATYGLGEQVMQVTVREVDPDLPIARCVDPMGRYVDVATSIYRTALRPEVGQIWMIDRVYGAWTFAAFLRVGGADPLAGFEPPPQDGPWTPLTLSNGWTASATSGDAPPRARVSADGLIQLSGVITGGTVPAFGSSLQVAALPAAFPARYRATRLLATHMPSGVSSPYVRGTLQPDGTILIAPAVSYTPTWIDLSGLAARVTGN